jgi:hypothetical protein
MAGARNALERLADSMPSEFQVGKETQEEKQLRANSQQGANFAKEQQALKNQVEKLLEKWQKSPEFNKDLASQSELMKQTKDLVQEFQNLAKDLLEDSQASQKTQEAAQKAEEARQMMQQSSDQAQQGDSANAQQSGKSAAQKLDQAAQAGSQAAQKLIAARKNSNPENQMNQALMQANQNTSQAGKTLKQGQLPAAQQAMQQASQALQQAANQVKEQLNQQGVNQFSGLKKNYESEKPKGFDLSQIISKELQTFEGRVWGDLPGELQTRLLQDIRSQFGPEYGNLIQYYFRQIAIGEVNK